MAAYALDRSNADRLWELSLELTERSPIPFLRKGSRDELRAATGSTELPALRLTDGTVITHSRAILSWIDRQK